VASSSGAFQNFPTKHPHALGGWNVNAAWAKDVDLILAIGARDFGGGAIPSAPEVFLSLPVIRLGIHTSDMSRNYQTDLAVLSDVKTGVSDLTAAVQSLMPKDKLAALAQARSAEIKAITSVRHANTEQAARANMGKSPIHPDELGLVMARTLDPNAIVVNESLTSPYGAFSFGHRDNEMLWLGNASYSLGWGVGAAIGAKLAAPDRQVVCSIGDGAVMYSASGFWTQVRYGIPVLTIVWNNHNYQTVRNAYYRYNGRMVQTNQYPAMYLGDPDIDFVALAKSQSVPGERVERGADLEAALKRGIAATRGGSPYLIDVVVARTGGGADSTWHQKFSLADTRTKKV
jgi:benzoylformate decarboxylase